MSTEEPPTEPAGQDEWPRLPPPIDAQAWAESTRAWATQGFRPAYGEDRRKRLGGAERAVLGLLLFGGAATALFVGAVAVAFVRILWSWG